MCSLLFFFFFVFFFKQKTAYEIKECDWSSDVCSSDLMMAMKSATDNAKEIQGDLTLEYNKLRQSEITTSLQDMVTARMAIE